MAHESNDFNPRSRKGNDRCHGASATRDTTFQSTFPQGERRSSDMTLNGRKLFQSTFPQGERRCTTFQSSPASFISIHVPARGTTANLNKFPSIFLYNKHNFSLYHLFFLLFSYNFISFFNISPVRISPLFFVHFWFAPTESAVDLLQFHVLFQHVLS